jgi:RNA polymerase sigma-70 factor (ECF subfamily)
VDVVRYPEPSIFLKLERHDSMSSFVNDVSNDPTDRFLRLLTQNERRLDGFVLALLPNWHDAEEVIQDTKLRLWQQFAEYDPTKDFGAWACTVAYYQVLAVRRRNQTKCAMLSEQFVEAVAAKANKVSSLAVDREDAMMRCLRRLSEAKNALLRRCYAGGETIVQVALQLGRTTESVRQELLRIRRTLHRCIDAALRQGDHQ